VAISGATQPGPNVFWVLGALKLARNSGSVGGAWLSAHIGDLERAVSFLLSYYDASAQLVNAPGPLFIDVFIRANFTSDTNAALVWLLDEMSDAERALNRTDFAEKYSGLRGEIAAAMNAQLLAAAPADHYVTQRNPDGSTRDFVDYDANLLAVAAGVPDSAALAEAILARVDSGACTRAGRATYVSEKFYDAQNCYSGNTGDSAVTMGRIAYLDALAQARYARTNPARLSLLRDAILAPIANDTFATTFMWERYTCGGAGTHNFYFHEYAEMLAMALHELAYGVRLGASSVTIDPLLRENFRMRAGAFDVLHTPSRVVFNVPAITAQLPLKDVTITQLQPNSAFAISGANALTGETFSGKCSSYADGRCDFQAPVDQDWTITVELA
jgi:hypothetical protein